MVIQYGRYFVLAERLKHRKQIMVAMNVIALSVAATRYMSTTMLHFDIHFFDALSEKLGVECAYVAVAWRYLEFGLDPGRSIEVTRAGIVRTAKKLAAALLIDPRVRDSMG